MDILSAVVLIGITTFHELNRGHVSIHETVANFLQNKKSNLFRDVMGV